MFGSGPKGAIQGELSQAITKLNDAQLKLDRKNAAQRDVYNLIGDARKIIAKVMQVNNDIKKLIDRKF